jgi:polyketide synthase 13
MEKNVLENWLIERIAEEVGLEPRIISASEPLYPYLMNGFQSLGVVADLENKLGRRLPVSILYARPTISALAEYLTAEKTNAFRLSKGFILRQIFYFF